ncbi:MAG TPA: beta-ketoacyl-ACP reductase [Planctomycetaceae bacterium]|nr:beta-ketoacyl-ACP reductase [Blastopirellula sp.]HAY82254.1 beta-ketoacyl-ACP reductase [Planctomycetaceae bacterium]
MIGIDLSGKVAVVTGSSRGLGAVIATTLDAAGATVVVNYLPDDEGTQQQAAEQWLAETQNGGLAVPADVRDPEAVQAMVRQVTERYQRIDMLVNNAGVLRDRTLKKMTSEEWQEVIDCNLTGVYQVSRAVAEVIQPHGRIVSLSSISAAMGFYGQANYAAAKAGIIGLTKVMSRELAKRDVTVNAVAPGVVDAGMGLSIPEEQRNRMLTEVPLQRFASAQDVANAILFLSSDLASYITGQTLHVNGGWWTP